MLMTKKRSRPPTPVRRRSPHSMMIAASKSPSTLGARRMSRTPGNAISGGDAGSAFTTNASLPIACSANAMASCDPIESPSGRACEDSTKRWRARTASTICRSSGLVVVIGGRFGRHGAAGAAGADAVEELLDPVLAGDRLVVEELEFGHALQPQPRTDLAPQEHRGAAQRLRAGGARLIVTERGVVDARVLEIGRDLDPGNGHEADARIVDLSRQHRRDFAANLIGDAVGSRTLSHLCRREHALHREHLDDVAHLEVVELVEADAALEAGLDLAD